MNPLDSFHRAASMITGIVDHVRDDQLNLPTACGDWDVRGVVNHLVQGNLSAIAAAYDEPRPEPVDRLGDDFRGAFARSLAEVTAVLEKPGMLERDVRTPIGPATGAFLVQMRLNEYLAHGWDIADATGQPTDLEPEIAERALAAWQGRFGEVPRESGGPFGPEVAAPADATAADRLAAFLGRSWVGE
jgi:uncharacterized protein (TIGR03086 family)